MAGSRNISPEQLAHIRGMWDAAWPGWEGSELTVALYFPDSCQYLPGERRRLLALGHPEIGRLMQLGGQRFGNEFCATACLGCRACIPSRIKLSDFKFSRSQRRTLRKNTDIRLEFGEVEPTEEKITMFRRFLKSRFNQVYPQFADPLLRDKFYHNWLQYVHGGTTEFRYYLKDRLVGVGAVDSAPDAGYSHYFFYDVSYPKRRLGIWSFLREIQWCLETGRDYLYIGFYNAQCRSMAYKTEFSGLQLLKPGEGWVSVR